VNDPISEQVWGEHERFVRERTPRGLEDQGLRAPLDEIEVFVHRFVVVNEAQAHAITLWAAHTWVIDAAHATPYLYVVSAEPESGKTRLLEVMKELELLCARCHRLDSW
jgi:hypothetical protein